MIIRFHIYNLELSERCRKKLILNISIKIVNFRTHVNDKAFTNLSTLFYMYLSCTMR